MSLEKDVLIDELQTRISALREEFELHTAKCPNCGGTTFSNTGPFTVCNGCGNKAWWSKVAALRTAGEGK